MLRVITNWTTSSPFRYKPPPEKLKRISTDIESINKTHLVKLIQKSAEYIKQYLWIFNQKEKKGKTSENS
jgi:hypothetical protein